MAATPYAETEALLAVLEGRDADAAAIVNDFYPGELREFARQVDTLGDLIEAAREAARQSKEVSR